RSLSPEHPRAFTLPHHSPYPCRETVGQVVCDGCPCDLLPPGFQQPTSFCTPQDYSMSIIELTEDNFSDTITPEATVVIDFWAPWCGPCRSFAPIFEKASHEHPDVVFAKVNTDEQEELASYFNIRSIPTIMVFRERVMLFAQPGAL